jgi:phosphate transport system substrate-binding protein
MKAAGAYRLLAFVSAATSLLITGEAARTQTPLDAAPSSLDAGKLDQARAAWLKTNKASAVHYTKRFDLSGLPVYKPGAPLAGTIHQWGSNYLADSMLERYLEDGFHRYHPNVKFDNNLKSTFIAIAGLYTGRADIAPMGRKATSDELQGYQRIFNSAPLEIAMASGSLDVPGWTFALVPLVNKANPIGRLSVEELDGIFGAERTGGMRGNSWDPGAARGASKNIRTWGQLGLTGDWANKPVHVYGYNLAYHFPQDFAEVVFKGGNKWNEGLQEFSNKAKGDGSGLISAGTLLDAAVSEDPLGITYTGINYATPRVKVLPLAGGNGSNYVAATLDSVQNHSYPLARYVYYYVKQVPGQPVDPAVKEFVRFVLSREGQEAVQRDGKYLPLTAGAAEAGLREIETVGIHTISPE